MSLLRRRSAPMFKFEAVLTGAAILLALAHSLKWGADLPVDVATIGTLAFFWFLVVYSVLFAALPAALFAGIGISVLVTLRARGLVVRSCGPTRSAQRRRHLRARSSSRGGCQSYD